MDNSELHHTTENLYELAPTGYLTVSDKGVVLNANQAVVTMLGVDRDKLLGKQISEFIFGEDQEKYFLHFKECFESYALQPWEMRMVRSDASVIWVDLKFTPVCQGEYWITLSDISGKKFAEDALKESEARYRRITEGLTDYLYTVRIENGSAVNTMQSPTCAVVTGYSPEDFDSDPYLWINMVAAEDRELVREQVQRILSGVEIQPIEHRIIRKDGETRWVSDTTILFKNSHGQLLSYDGVVKDITERKLMETAREEALAQIRKLEGIIPICMYCKKIRDDQNTWNQLEQYISDHSEALFSHGMCPDCLAEQMKNIKC